MKKILFLLLFLVCIKSALALPSLPCDFYGSVTINGNPAPAGTEVKAYINSGEYDSFIVKNEGLFGIMTIKGDDLDTPIQDGGVNGDEVRFKVNGRFASQTSTWELGDTKELSLEIQESTSSSSSSKTIVTEIVSENVSIDVNESGENLTIELIDNEVNDEIKENDSKVLSKQTENEKESDIDDTKDEKKKDNSFTFWLVLLILIVVIILFKGKKK
jgi:hypothetical protein